MARSLILPALDAVLRSLPARRLPGAVPSGVLLLRSGGLGDTILFAHVFPYFRALALAGEKITVLVRHDAAKTAFLFGPDVEILSVDYGRFLRNPVYRMQVATDLRRRNFRIAASTDERRHPLIDEAMIAATGAPDRPAMEAASWPKYAARLVANRRFFTRLLAPSEATLHVIEKWTRFANWLTGSNHPAPLALLHGVGLAQPAALERPTVVIQPFAAIKQKQITPSDVAALIDAMPAGTDLVITGTASELEQAPKIGVLSRRNNVRFEGGTFESLVPLLRAAQLVVSVDTALMHLAAGLGTPTLGLASAAWVGEIVPYPAALMPPNFSVLYHDMPCAGCQAACHLPAENGMYPCLARLDRQLILAKVRAVVQQ